MFNVARKKFHVSGRFINGNMAEGVVPLPHNLELSVRIGPGKGSVLDKVIIPHDGTYRCALRQLIQIEPLVTAGWHYIRVNGVISAHGWFKEGEMGQTFTEVTLELKAGDEVTFDIDGHEDITLWFGGHSYFVVEEI